MPGSESRDERESGAAGQGRFRMLSAHRRERGELCRRCCRIVGKLGTLVAPFLLLPVVVTSFSGQGSE